MLKIDEIFTQFAVVPMVALCSLLVRALFLEKPFDCKRYYGIEPNLKYGGAKDSKDV
mgnify:FL=1